MLVLCPGHPNAVNGKYVLRSHLVMEKKLGRYLTKAAQAHGRFCWGVANWELRDPKEKLAELDEAIVRLQVERQKYI